MTCRVLLIEDNDDVRDAFAAILRAEGHDVVTAADGREALEVLKRSDGFGLILLDLMMPDIDGWRLRERQRELGLHLSTPLVVVSGRESDPLTENPDLDAAEILGKPVPPSDLLEVVEEHCRRSETRHPE